MAAVSRNAVGTQLKRMASAANSAPIAGIAMLMDEPIKGVKKLARVAMMRAAILVELPSALEFSFTIDHSPFCFPFYSPREYWAYSFKYVD
jgi:hypothetical protein